MKDHMLSTLTKYWGYTSFRPFQEEAIRSILSERDSLTVLPTGGGKSVCFQVPALIREGMAVIISPLISLMKDQVDYLKDIGISAECLNSSLTAAGQRAIIEKIGQGNVKLLYISPERLLLPEMRDTLRNVKLSFFVIDEAHCISHWGHNFREEYRLLRVIKDEFKNSSVHAFTATATEEVQRDIIEQLKLVEPDLYIGNVDRPNLVYRLLPRAPNVITQIVDVIKKHANEPGIIYCLRRADVDSISDKLNRLGYTNLPYHAGLADGTRKKNQDEFSTENVNIMVATIAFGMGVDRSNIRYVIHAAMPKSIEHYQQETGRAGRDGLPADCYMFYSGQDYKTWEYMLHDSPDREVLLGKLKALYNFCTRPACRHSYLVKYFGQEYGQDNCNACDLCLGEMAMVEDPLIIGQKVISCVARVKEKFGADHVATVLKGTLSENVEKWGHQNLSTFGLMQEETKIYIRHMVEQLLGQGFLKRDGEFATLAITETGWRLLKGELTPVLAKPVEFKMKKEIAQKQKRRHAQDWEGVDETLFSLLKDKRSELAKEKNVPAYIVFSDKTLQDIARKKPTDKGQFADVFGVGETKLEQYADTFCAVVQGYVNG